MARSKSASNSKSIQIDLSRLLRIDDVDNFREVREISATTISPRHLQAVRSLDERCRRAEPLGLGQVLGEQTAPAFVPRRDPACRAGASGGPGD